MGRAKSALLKIANWMFNPFGLTVIPSWKWQEARAEPAETFEVAGQKYPFFLHHHNCGRHPETATERTVELALADRWLTAVPTDRLVEVGAVTPYYWPRRIQRVVDPVDPHPQVSERADILELDLTGRALLCLSTLEHVGTGDYGLASNPAACRQALEKVLAEAAAFLMSVPFGYNPRADEAFFATPRPSDVSAFFLVRTNDPPYWRQVFDPEEARVPYGPTPETPLGSRGANSVIIWERGGYLTSTPPLHDRKV